MLTPPLDSGERFYLHLLLTCIKGATSFKDLCTVDGVPCGTFKEACFAFGLLDDDRELHQCLTEARHMAVGRQLRDLFVSILRECTPARPRELWDTFWPDICDDLRHQLQQKGIENPCDEDVQDYGLYLIDKLLSHTGKRVQE